MAFVRTFVVYDERGVPDRLIRDWLSQCEKEGPLRVTVTPFRTATALLVNVVATLSDTWKSMDIDPPPLSLVNGPTSSGGVDDD